MAFSVLERLQVASLLQPFKPPLEGEFKDYKASACFHWKVTVATWFWVN